MLHVVQVVLSGIAEIPMLFFDRGKAESAYVECVKKYWAQSYAAYCERSGVGIDSFASARAFVEAFDLAEKSRILYWTVQPEDTEGAEPLEEQREQILRLTKEMTQTSRTVTEGLAGLMDTMTGLTKHVAGIDALLAHGGHAGGPEAVIPLPSSLPQQEEPEKAAEKYATPEWKAFVASITSICGGGRNECLLFSRQDWRQDVYGNATSFEYWEWVAAKFDTYMEKGRSDGYTVIKDPDNPGEYRFKTPEGAVSEISCYTEEEAWCRAGLHAEGHP